MNTNKYNFLRFLKDEKFIEWQLFPSDELTTYWESFLQEHPYEKENIALAKNFFQNIQLSSKNKQFSQILTSQISSYYNILIRKIIFSKKRVIFSISFRLYNITR